MSKTMSERLQILGEALENTNSVTHLVINSDDPVLLAAVAIINKFGFWENLRVGNEHDFLEAIEIAQKVVTQPGTRTTDQISLDLDN